jgi:hypothetical protein
LALTAAFFSIPQWQLVFHFELNRASFVITFVVVAIVLNILLRGFSALSRWWNGLDPSKRAFPLEKAIHCLSTVPELFNAAVRKLLSPPSGRQVGISEV